jgi:hypothetical protein
VPPVSEASPGNTTENGAAESPAEAIRRLQREGQTLRAQIGQGNEELSNLKDALQGQRNELSGLKKGVAELLEIVKTQQDNKKR